MSHSDPIMRVQLSIRVITAHVHYNLNKTVLYVLSITGTIPFTYLYSMSLAGAVSVYLFIATVANWYVYCRSIFHIGVCHWSTVCFLLSLKFGSRLFSLFFHYFICQRLKIFFHNN